MVIFNYIFQKDAKVCVLGAAGGIGQPLSLLLKNTPLVSHLALYDIAHTPGVAADLSHIETKAKVTGHMGPSELEAAVTGADIVLIPAGVPRKPGKLLLLSVFPLSYILKLVNEKDSCSNPDGNFENTRKIFCATCWHVLKSAHHLVLLNLLLRFLVEIVNSTFCSILQTN